MIPGVTAMSGCWSPIGVPIVQGDDVLTVLPGTMAEAELTRRLGDSDAAVIMKVGRNLPKIRRALGAAGKLDRAVYVERGTMPNGCAQCGLPTRPDDQAPYFALVLVAGWERTAVSGRLAVVGLGPGSAEQVTPEAAAPGRRLRAISSATGPISTGSNSARPGRAMPPTTARSSTGRAAALARAADGAEVCVVSGGDPGVFAMAAAVCEAIESGPAAWRALELVIVPGVTAMLAVAARVGAPLGHDFCALSLSDNLKPWEVVEARLGGRGRRRLRDRALQPDEPRQALAARPLPSSSCAKACRRIPRWSSAAPPGGPTSASRVTTLAEADAAWADMATCVIIGSRETRTIERRRPAAARLYAALPCGGEAMSDAVERGPDVRHRRQAALRRASQEQHLDAQRPCRRDLGIGRRAAAVLGNDGIDAVLGKQPLLVGRGEWTPVEPVDGLRDGKRRRDRVDAADQVEVLRRGGKGLDLLPAEGQEDPPRCFAERRDRLPRIADHAPAVAGGLRPGWAHQRQSRHPGRRRSQLGMARDPRGVWMRGVDQKLDALPAKIVGEALGAAEPAASDRHRLARRMGGAPGERQGDRQRRLAGQFPGKQPGLRGAAKDQDGMSRVHGR